MLLKMATIESTSSRFYKELFFVQKCFAQLFIYLKFRFVIFGAKLLENVDENDNCIPQTSQSIVNFINILQADFAPIFFRQKITKLNCNWRITAQSTKNAQY